MDHIKVISSLPYHLMSGCFGRCFCCCYPTVCEYYGSGVCEPKIFCDVNDELAENKIQTVFVLITWQTIISQFIIIIIDSKYFPNNHPKSWGFCSDGGKEWGSVKPTSDVLYLIADTRVCYTK